MTFEAEDFSQWMSDSPVGYGPRASTPSRRRRIAVKPLPHDELVRTSRTVWTHHLEIQECLGRLPAVLAEAVALHRGRAERQCAIHAFVQTVGDHSIAAKDRVFAAATPITSPASPDKPRGVRDSTVSTDPMVLAAALDALGTALDAYLARPLAARCLDEDALAALTTRFMRIEFQCRVFDDLVDHFVALTTAVVTATKSLATAARDGGFPPTCVAALKAPASAAAARTTLHARRESEWSLAVVAALEALEVLEAEHGRPLGALLAVRARFDAARQAQRVAVNEIVTRNLPMVAFVVRKLRFHTQDVEDALQVGAEGLILAAQRFKYWSGSRFSTYAVYWIKNRIDRLIAARPSVGYAIPVRLEERVVLVERMRDELRARLGETPTAAQIAAALGLQLAEVDECTACYMPTRGIEALPIAAPERLDVDRERECTAAIREALATLPADQALILSLHYGLDGEAWSFETITQRLNLPSGRPHRLKKAAFARLKASPHAARLAQFLD